MTAAKILISERTPDFLGLIIGILVGLFSPSMNRRRIIALGLLGGMLVGGFIGRASTDARYTIRDFLVWVSLIAVVLSLAVSSFR